MINLMAEYGIHFSYYILFLALAFFRVFYAVCVYVNAKRRQLDNPVFWSVFCAVFGLLAFIMFFAINAGQGEKRKRITAQTVSLSVLLAVCCILTLSYAPVKVNEIVYDYKDAQHDYVQKKSAFKYVTYDKMGNEYDVVKLYISNIRDMYSDFEDIKLFYEDGTQAGYRDGVVINEEGYAVNLDIDYENWRSYYGDDIYVDVYIDEDGNKFYNSYDCSWDENGNLYISGDSELNDFLTLDNTESNSDDFDYLEEDY